MFGLRVRCESCTPGMAELSHASTTAAFWVHVHKEYGMCLHGHRINFTQGIQLQL
jgi:hypothetical protein